ncbi:BQ2448_5653 [Microbotryum intermedium]|uniref:BQ2448_5653 protein n=1 Tax=Microbotryum intermedium TaxID=269621 RepID=A0A238F1T8_9BASI|nr:BQ2448_5653 [Microbotryum intermedium]
MTSTPTNGSNALSSSTVPTTPSTRYSVEIAQMLFVLGRRADVDRDLDEEVLVYLEQIVQSQLVDMVTEARSLAARRVGSTSSGTGLGPSSTRQLQVDDLLFLIRHDTTKLNRLKTYLGWKDVRKKFKDTDQDDEPEVMDEPVAVAARSTSERAYRAPNKSIKLPWEITTIYGDCLPEASEDEDTHLELTREMRKQLKDADELTKHMTKEEYNFYTECRQASFVYKKGKKFREFLNLGIVIESTLTDDALDVLGFLAFEIIRTISEAGLEFRKIVTLAKAENALRLLRKEKEEEERQREKKEGVEESAKGKGKEEGERKKRNLRGKGRETELMDVDGVEGGEEQSAMDSPPVSSSKRQRKSEPSTITTTNLKDSNEFKESLTKMTSTSSPPRPHSIPTGLFSAPPEPVSKSSMVTTPGGTHRLAAEQIVQALVAEVATKEKQALQWGDVHGGVEAWQRGRIGVKKCGMGNWRAGVQRSPSRFF